MPWKCRYCELFFHQDGGERVVSKKTSGMHLPSNPLEGALPRLSHPYTQRERIFLTRELTCLKADIILRGFPNLASSSGVLLDGVWSHALFPPKAKPFWKLVVFYWEEMCTNLCCILVSPRTVNYCKIGYFRKLDCRLNTEAQVREANQGQDWQKQGCCMGSYPSRERKWPCSCLGLGESLETADTSHWLMTW